MEVARQVPVRLVVGDSGKPVIALLDPDKPLADAEQQRRIARAILSSIDDLDSNVKMDLKEIARGAGTAQFRFSLVEVGTGKPILNVTNANASDTSDIIARHTPRQLAEKVRSMGYRLDKVAIRVEPTSQVGAGSPARSSPFYAHAWWPGGVEVAAALHYWPSTPPLRRCPPAFYLAVGALRGARLYTSAIVPVYVDAEAGGGSFRPPSLKSACSGCGDGRCKSTCLFTSNPFPDAGSLASLIERVVTGRAGPVASVLSSLEAVAESIVGIGVPRLRFSLGPQVTWNWPNYLKGETPYATPYDLVARMPTYHFNVKHVESEAEARARLLHILQGLLG